MDGQDGVINKIPSSTTLLNNMSHWYGATATSPREGLDFSPDTDRSRSGDGSSRYEEEPAHQKILFSEGLNYL